MSLEQLDRFALSYDRLVLHDSPECPHQAYVHALFMIMVMKMFLIMFMVVVFTSNVGQTSTET